jgi:pimeloyl-ACP methyl ester carboxylesterase
MAFAYQFPERTHTLTLIASGGLGPELSIALRTACLPGILRAARTMHMLTPPWATRLAHHGATALGLARRADLEELGRALRALHNLDSRRAYLHTLRGVATWSGQRLDATDRLYLLSELPTLLITGRRDGCIPYQHTLRAHQLLPGSRLELLDAGHFPHTEHPGKVSALILELLRLSERCSTQSRDRPAS